MTPRERGFCLKEMILQFFVKVKDETAFYFAICEILAFFRDQYM